MALQYDIFRAQLAIDDPPREIKMKKTGRQCHRCGAFLSIYVTDKTNYCSPCRKYLRDTYYDQLERDPYGPDSRTLRRRIGELTDLPHTRQQAGA